MEERENKPARCAGCARVGVDEHSGTELEGDGDEGIRRERAGGARDGVGAHRSFVRSWEPSGVE